MSSFSMTNSGKTKDKKRKHPSDDKPRKQQLVVSTDDEEFNEGQDISHTDHLDTVCENELDCSYNDRSAEVGFLDSESHVMDSIINNTDKNSDNCNSTNNNANCSPLHDNPPSPNTIASRTDDIFCHDYVINPLVLHLNPVSEKLAETFTDWCRTAPRKEEVKEMFKQALVLTNIEGLYPVRINDGLYRKLPF